MVPSSRCTVLLALLYLPLAAFADPAPDILTEDAPRYFELDVRLLRGEQWGNVGSAELDPIGGHKTHGGVHDRPDIPNDSAPSTGRPIDSRGVLGLTHPGWAGEGMLSVYFGSTDRLTLRVFSAHFFSRLILRTSFNYNDDDFQQGDRVRTEMELRMVSLDYQHLVGNLLRTDVWLGGGIGHDLTNAGVSHAPGAAGGTQESTTALPLFARLSTSTALAAHLSVRTDFRLSPLGVPFYGTSKMRTVHGAEYGAVRFAEGTVALRWQIFHFVGIEAGVEGLWLLQHYKGLQTDGDPGNNRIHVRAVWPFVGIAIAF